MHRWIEQFVQRRSHSEQHCQEFRNLHNEGQRFPNRFHEQTCVQGFFHQDCKHKDNKYKTQRKFVRSHQDLSPRDTVRQSPLTMRMRDQSGHRHTGESRHPATPLHFLRHHRLFQTSKESEGQRQSEHHRLVETEGMALCHSQEKVLRNSATHVQLSAVSKALFPNRGFPESKIDGIDVHHAAVSRQLLMGNQVRNRAWQHIRFEPGRYLTNRHLLAQCRRHLDRVAITSKFEFVRLILKNRNSVVASGCSGLRRYLQQNSSSASYLILARFDRDVSFALVPRSPTVLKTSKRLGQVHTSTSLHWRHVNISFRTVGVPMT